MSKTLNILLLLSAALVSTPLRAQRSEIGFGIGMFNYTGDLSRAYRLENSRPAATAFYRSNLSHVISFKAAFTGGKLGASDRHPIDPFAGQRNASFDIFVMEASTVMEYHFLNWREHKRFVRFTPYLFGGLGLFGISGNNNKRSEYSNIQAAVPFGGGVKYIVNPKWYLALEFGIRKTFFDYLDDISYGNGRNKDYQYGNPFDNDNYFFWESALPVPFTIFHAP